MIFNFLFKVQYLKNKRFNGKISYFFLKVMLAFPFKFLEMDLIAFSCISNNVSLKTHSLVNYFFKHCEILMKFFHEKVMFNGKLIIIDIFEIKFY